MVWVDRRPVRRQGRFVVASAFALACVAGCSSVNFTDKIDYRSAEPPKQLDIPPELSQLPKDDRFQVPSVSARDLKAQPQQPGQPALPSAVPGVNVARFERDGSQRWLAVDLPPEQVLEQVPEMFKSVGLGIERDDSTLGIVETVWAENHARLPLDWLRKTLGRALDTFYSTSELDKYRARIERTEKNTSEVFLSH